MKIDLHSHTHYSDGQLSPKELIDRAHNMQVDVLAITDHDTVEAIQEALDYQALQKRPLQIVAGVELSTSWHGFDIHILGLKVDHLCQAFLENLDTQAQERDSRAHRIAEKLAKAGVADIYPEAKRLAGKGQMSRAHFARAMVNRGEVRDAESAFQKYLGKGKRAHVKPTWISISEAVKWIHQAGGKAVLAHPGHYDMSTKWLRRLLSEFTLAGGNGMEVNHSHLSPQKRELLKQLALEHRLEASAGSDFHFPGRWTELGRHLTLPDELTPVWHNWDFMPRMNTTNEGQVA